MRRVVLLGLLLGGQAALAQTFFYLPFKMLNNAASPFPYYVDDRSASPAGLELSGVQAAVNRSWASWNAVNASPKVIAKGFTTGSVPRPPDPYDTFSVTPVWLSSQDQDFLFVFGAGNAHVASITLPLSYAGVLQNCDVFLNAVNVQWSTNDVTPSSAEDVETVMLHEAGHCLGLDHYGGVGNVMNPDLALGVSRRVLGPGDPTALASKNPLSGSAGAPCDADGGCGTNVTLKCLTQPTTQGLSLKMCSNGCTTGTNGGCTSPQYCQASAVFNGYNGACLLPGGLITQVGKACAADGECGSAVGKCSPPVAGASGATIWANGYCYQTCEAGKGPCPTGSQCVTMGGAQLCLQNCRVGLADCRPEYTCLDDGSGTSGTCVPRCGGDVDCPDPTLYFCHQCDGLCMSRNNISGQIGDGCTDETFCGPGQICKALTPNGVKTCTAQCARGCGACPTGSHCNPIVGGDLYCTKDCTGPGTCPAGLRCADTVTGKGCLAACTQNSECPVGLNCYNGECYPPETDAGCGTLCTKPDGGKPITPGGKDAGTGGGGGNGGCGCTADASSTLPMLFGALLVLLAARRFSWPVR
jgi:hypothetical protein